MLKGSGQIHGRIVVVDVVGSVVVDDVVGAACFFCPNQREI